MSNYQLFRKIRLVFDHVLIPLKSELDFNKLLIANDLIKYSSLQTFVFWRPGKQHLCRGNAGEEGEGGEEGLVGPVELVGEADFTGMFFTPQPSGSFWDD
jgi:hypothetical protein